MHRWVALFLAALLAACSPQPQPAHPAFWEVTGPRGEKGWLLGTIHALPRPAAWRSPVIDDGLAGSDVIAVEISDLDNAAAMAAEFARLAHSPGLPPLSARVDPGLRAALAKALKAGKLTEADFADTETWSAALTLARAGGGGLDSANGIDRAVLRLADNRPVIELEGTRSQLSLFDTLPEAEQRDLLEAVLRDSVSETTGPSLAEAWRRGDFGAIEAETHRGMLADPELREVLFTGRNRAWTAKIATLLTQGRRPFVAVGAAHMAGGDGLPAMLAARGYTVRRLQ